MPGGESTSSGSSSIGSGTATTWETDASGFIWRKYGEKTVGARKSAVKRAYFRCLCHKSENPCPAKKRVDRVASSSPEDPPLSVSYIGKHNHSARVCPDSQGSNPSAARSPFQSSAALHLQRTGFENMKPEELAREMHKDIMVHLAEAAAINGTDPCSAIHSCCHKCAGQSPELQEAPRGPLLSQGTVLLKELELQNDTSGYDHDELFPHEVDGYLTIQVEEYKPTSPCSTLSPITPESTFTPSQGIPAEGVSEGAQENRNGASAAVHTKHGIRESSFTQAKGGVEEDVGTLVEKLQQEIRSRRRLGTGRDACGRTRGGAIAGKENVVEPACCISQMDSGMHSLSIEEGFQLTDDPLVEFPPLDLGDVQKFWGCLEQEGNATLV